MLKDLGWKRAETTALFLEFDTDSSGSVSLHEFLVGLRGSMNDRREQVALQAFS